MKPGQIYTREDIQQVWKQFHTKPSTVVWSDDNGETWNDVPSMDTGKWPLFSIRNGNWVNWVFKIRD